MSGATPDLITQANQVPQPSKPTRADKNRARVECQNPDTPQEVLLAHMRRTPTPHVSLAVANHPNLDSDGLAETHELILAAIKRQTMAPPEYAEARLSILRNPLCPWSVAERELDRPLSPAYVEALAQNPTLGQRAMEAVRPHYDLIPAIQRALLRGKLVDKPQRYNWEAAVRSPAKSVREEAARASGLPDDLQMALVTDSDPQIRLALAENPQVSLEAAVELIRHDSSQLPFGFRLLVHYDSATGQTTWRHHSAHVVVAALSSPLAKVRDLAREHPDLPPEYRGLVQVAQ